MTSLNEFKKSFDFRDEKERGAKLHLNSAGMSPLCRPAREAVQHALQNAAELGSHSFAETLNDYAQARAAMARLVNVTSDQVAMFPTCATAISQVALGMKLRAGENIVTWDQEYPSNAYPWHRAAAHAGAELIRVPSNPDLSVDVNRLIAAITPNTRAVAVSWVQYQSGAVTELKPVAEACRKNNAWLVVDAIQGLGVMPLDMTAIGIDALCTGTHKWMCGMLGHGFLVLAKHRLAELEPLSVGAMTYGTSSDRPDFSRQPHLGIQRFEPGSLLVCGAAAARGAIELLLATGVDVICREALRLSDKLANALRERGHRLLRPDTLAAERSPILTFVPRGGAAGLAKVLATAGVAFAERGGGIRLSPHGFNDDADLHRVLDIVDSVH